MYRCLLVSCAVVSGVSPSAGRAGAHGEPVEPLPSILASRSQLGDARTKPVPHGAPSERRPHGAISPEMSAKLSAVVIRVAPPPDTSASASGTVSVRGSDSADVVRLDPFLVEENRLPRFKERELLTLKGKLALARRRYPGLGPLGDAAALLRLAEDLDLERRREIADLQSLFEIGDTRLSPEHKRSFDQATRPARRMPSGFEGPFRVPK